MDATHHTSSVFGAAVNSSSLSLIADYGSDDDEDEVPGGIGVQTKRELKSDDNQDHENGFPNGPSPGRKRLKGSREPAVHSPAVAVLPNPLRSNLPVEKEWTDDPAKHGGRVRSFPHMRNNWATYVYAEPDRGVAERIAALQSELCAALSLEPVDTPHLSLTRVVTVRHHWIHPFVAGVRESVTAASSFHVDLSGFEVFVNEEGTRTFVGLRAISDHLPALVARLDAAMAQFDLPPFYTPARYHISLGWCLGDKRDNLEAKIPELECCEASLSFSVGKINVKCGNKVFSVALK